MSLLLTNNSTQHLRQLLYIRFTNKREAVLEFTNTISIHVTRRCHPSASSPQHDATSEMLNSDTRLHLLLTSRGWHCSTVYSVDYSPVSSTKSVPYSIAVCILLDVVVDLVLCELWSVLYRNKIMMSDAMRVQQQNLTFLRYGTRQTRRLLMNNLCPCKIPSSRCSKAVACETINSILLANPPRRNLTSKK